MANGKIVYTPLAFYAVTPAALLSRANDGSFAFGANSFSIDAIVTVDATASASIIISKTSANFATTGTGLVFAVTSSKQLSATFNDGSGQFSVNSGAATIAPNVPAWVRLAVNRAGYIQLYVNGVAVGTPFDCTAKTGTLSSTGTLYGPSRNTAPITCSYLRIDLGRVLPEAWMTQEWARLQYGYPRRPLDFTAVWDFANTLTDMTGVYTFAGTATYSTGYPSGPISYTFPIAYQWGHDAQYLDTDGTQRSLDGTLTLYKGGRKRQYGLDFECDFAQKTVLEAAWASGYPLTFYEDENKPGLAAAILESPKIQSIFDGYFAVSVKVEEI